MRISTSFLLSVGFVLICNVTVLIDGNENVVCPPARIVNFHMADLLGLWYQYVYLIRSNSGVLWSCETLNVTFQDGKYVAVIDTSTSTDILTVRELLGPVFYYINTPGSNSSVTDALTFAEHVTTYNKDSTKVSIENIFRLRRYDRTFVTLASRHGYLDPNIHDVLLQSVGFQLSPNVTVFQPDECPKLVV